MAKKRANIDIDALARQAIAFFENLKLVGSFTGRPFVLRDWQRRIVEQIFTIDPKTGQRKYSRVFLLLPRKQAKTLLAACLCLFFLVCGEPGQEIYSAAATREQAGTLFRYMAQIVRQDPFLSRLCDITDSQKRISVPTRFSFYRALSADGGSNHSLNPSVVICDELHAWKGTALWDALTTGSATRVNPLNIIITTQTHDKNSVCYQQYDYAKRVRDGEIDDPSYLPILYEAPADADWTDEKIWKRAMPALGDFCDLEYIRAKFREAKQIPATENAFRQLYLCQLVEQATRWLQVERWKGCILEDPIDFDGEPVWGAVDMSSTSDLTSYSLCGRIDGKLAFKTWTWLPEESFKQRCEKEPRWKKWHSEGWVSLCPGESIDPDQVAEEIAQINQYEHIQSIALDMFQGLGVSSKLKKAGFEVVPWKPFFSWMGPPCKEFERLLISDKIVTERNDLVDWTIGNVCVKRNDEGLIRPVKPVDDGTPDSRAKKIDPVVTMLMALGIMLSQENEPQAYNPFSNPDAKTKLRV